MLIEIKNFSVIGGSLPPLKMLTPQQSLVKMQEISNRFYSEAIRTECHFFIEFCGLMNESIKACEAYQKVNPDKDFRECSTHTGKQLNYAPWQVNYINEKLECIYQGLVVLTEEKE